MKTLKRCIAIVLSFLLCVNTLPASAFSEVVDAEQGDGLSVFYRRHTAGDVAYGQDEGWLMWVPTQGVLTSQDDDVSGRAGRELDGIALKISDGLPGIEYLVRDEQGLWQDVWTADGAEAQAASITGVAARLDDALDEQYDVWYRVADDSGTWLEWVKGDGLAACDDSAGGAQAVSDVEFALTPEGQEPDSDNHVDDSAAGADAADVADVDPTADAVPAGAADAQAATQSVAKDEAAPDEATAQTQQDPEQDPEQEAQQDPEQEAQQDPRREEGAAVVRQVAPEQKAATQERVLLAAAEAPGIEYRARVQRVGWKPWVRDGAKAGTTGKKLRLEALYFHLTNASGDVLCDAYVQGKGWMPTAHAGQLVGTKKSLRIEALKLKLSGEVSKGYDIWYRAHVQGVGWQKWVRNGSKAGTTGRSRRIEAIEVMLVLKGGTIPTTSGAKYKDSSTASSVGVHYQAYVQKKGWRGEVANGKTAGTTGKKLRMEAFRIRTSGLEGGVTYQAYVQGKGWMGLTSDGAVAGLAGKSKRIEAIRINLNNARDIGKYNIYYRTHIQTYGWTAWAKNGEKSGSMGLSKRVEAIQVKLVRVSKQAPKNSKASKGVKCWGLTGVDYRVNIAGSAWQGAKADGATAGATGKSTRIRGFAASLSDTENGGIRYMVADSTNTWSDWAANGNEVTAASDIIGLRIQLTGALTSIARVWYRVYTDQSGWMGWTSDAGFAGSDTRSRPIKAIQVRILKKGAKPGSTAKPYYYARQLNGVDVSSHNWNAKKGGINISKLTTTDFVVVKATQYDGVKKKYVNPYFKNMADQTLKSGKLLGLYHYATGANARNEANFFCDTVEAYKGKAILFLDWEGYQNPKFETGVDVAWCKTFLDQVKKRMGGTPMIYMSKSVTNYYDWSKVAKLYPLWGAQYASYNVVNGFLGNPWQSSEQWGVWGAKPLIFQYTSVGKIPEDNGGSAINFDLDLFYGTKNDWKKYVG